MGLSRYTRDPGATFVATTPFVWRGASLRPGDTLPPGVTTEWDRRCLWTAGKIAAVHQAPATVPVPAPVAPSPPDRPPPKRHRSGA